MDTKSINIVTCAYCGIAYPADTPTSGSKILTNHIKICEKHPLRAAEAKIAKLRSALVSFVGVDGKKKLQEMESVIRASEASAEEKAVAIEAIKALMDTAEGS